jgi:hypothetical protein
MAPPSRKVMRTFARLGGVLVLAACDPNIVIGSRLPRDDSEGGGSGWEAGGVAGISAGVAGSGASAGASSTGGSGDEPGAGTAGDTSSSGTAGEPSTPLFEADQEDGSLEHWDSGPDTDAGGWYGDDDSGPEYSDTGPAHSGSGAVKVTVDTAPGDRISRLYRRLTTADAYYSAWFYLAEDHTAPSWWSIFLFRAVQERAASIDLWSVNLVRRADDQLTFGVFDHAANELIQSPTEPVVEVGKWFQLQAFLHAVPGEPSKVVFYLDGVEFLALDDATAAPEGEPLYWVIGNGGSKLVPPISTVYIDDAVIDDELVGP